MIFTTTAFGAIYGCIVGLVWAFALNLLIKSGMTYGVAQGDAIWDVEKERKVVAESITLAVAFRSEFEQQK